MARQFSDADLEKRVVTADGQEVGSVRAVTAGRATVGHATDDGRLTDEIKRLLGWAGGGESHDLRGDQVSWYDEETVHLRPLR